MCSTLNVFSKIVVPYGCCCSQPKYLRALTPIFQLVGNKLVCVRQLCGKHTILNTITLWILTIINMKRMQSSILHQEKMQHKPNVHLK